ncbi:50S ribosomal protein L15 [Candidatus Nomurabacteria bacterium]|jgi:large subunit ribosomal protein L15|nr:50S ribosomal protein L15 [Candidatus Saccharibacteria bacterium]MCB9821756.1 50S ribosomal protein L15 [Candidatus Nomurabacteria bacterium]MDQ5969551.1 large subunit ribosomal protein [Patescibacteria group bacterium]
MKFHELDLTKKASKTRVGRGISAGKGKTAGRGTKGQKARTGKKLRPGFEGGQNPLMMRIPKLKGFKSYRVKAQVVYTGNLELFPGKVVDNFTLTEHGYVADPYSPIKIISKGELKKTLTVNVQNASKTAIEAIAKAGGNFEATELPKRVKAVK